MLVTFHCLLAEVYFEIKPTCFHIFQDIQYADIDYMDARKDFTIDPVNFADLPQYFQELRANHSMKTIIILVSIKFI